MGASAANTSEVTAIAPAAKRRITEKSPVSAEKTIAAPAKREGEAAASPSRPPVAATPAPGIRVARMAVLARPPFDKVPCAISPMSSGPRASACTPFQRGR